MTGDIIKTEYVAIELSEYEAQLFKVFMKNHAKIEFMAENGVFDIVRGSAVLNFSGEGKLVSIERRLFTYAQNIVNKDNLC